MQSSALRTSLRAAAGTLAAGALADQRDATGCGWNPFRKREWAPPPTIDELFAKKIDGVHQNAGMNKPTAGYRSVKALPEGPAPIQLYSLATPNGVKVSILLEELGVDYDAHTVNIVKEEQFTTGFVSVNPNSKIPAAIDKDGPGGKPMYLWESAAIMLYLAEKHGKFVPKDARLKHECMQWLFFQMGGVGPMTGQFNHFNAYAPKEAVQARDYGVKRYGMIAMTHFDVLDKALEGKRYLVGDEYSIADMINYPWFEWMRSKAKNPRGTPVSEFMGTARWKNLNAWADRIKARPAVERGMTVCGFDASKPAKPWLTGKEAVAKKKVTIRRHDTLASELMIEAEDIVEQAQALSEEDSKPVYVVHGRGGPTIRRHDSLAGELIHDAGIDTEPAPQKEKPVIIEVKKGKTTIRRHDSLASEMIHDASMDDEIIIESEELLKASPLAAEEKPVYVVHGKKGPTIRRHDSLAGEMIHDAGIDSEEKVKEKPVIVEFKKGQSPKIRRRETLASELIHDDEV